MCQCAPASAFLYLQTLLCKGIPSCPPQVCCAACCGSGSTTSLQEAGSGPGLWWIPANVWTQKLYLQEMWHYTRVGRFGGIIPPCFQCVAHLALYKEYSTSHCPLQDVSGHWWGLGFCSHPRDRDTTRAWLIASGVESSQANGHQICLLALTLPAKHAWACSWDFALSPFLFQPAQMEMHCSAGWS